VAYLVLVAGGITMIVPLLWMVSTSLKEPGAVFTPGEWFPTRYYVNIDNKWYPAVKMDKRLAQCQVRIEQGAEKGAIRTLVKERIYSKWYAKILGLPPYYIKESKHTLPVTILSTTEELYRMRPEEGSRANKADWYPGSDVRRKFAPVWENYSKAWNAQPFGRFYLNSIFVAVCTTAGQILTCSLAAYAFSRLNFPGRDKLFFAYLATMMIPGSVTMIPVFILLKNIGWIDTYKALIIPGIFSAYGTFMLRQFFMSLPTDLEDAAKIDGCGFFSIYWRIVLPLSKPALATLITFTFMGSWQSFMWPLIVINSTDKKTLPVGLAAFQGLYTTDWTLLMAGSIIVLLPVIIVFVFNQRFFVEGIKLTGIKG
jgi:multiple sugar transport system permease protein